MTHIKICGVTSVGDALACADLGASSIGLNFVASSPRRIAPEKAREIAREAAKLLDEGSPSLLNEGPVFLALHDACVDLGDLSEARDAILRGIPRLATRVQGLSGTPYARDFLTQLAANAGLLAAAEASGLVPKELSAIAGTSTGESSDTISPPAETVAAPEDTPSTVRTP